MRRAVTGRWGRQWRAPAWPKPAYDVVIVGAGGHGLATAYYLAKDHGIRNIAVLDKGWLGGGKSQECLIPLRRIAYRDARE